MKDNWEVKRLGELLQRTETINPTLNPEQGFIYIDVSSVSNKTFEIESVNLLKGKDAPSRARKLIKTGDIIFATVRPTLRRIAIIPEEYNNQVCSTGYFVLRAKENICNSLIFYYLLTDSFNERMEKLQKGASYPAVTDGEVREQIIHYPKSLAEQQRIVAILDEAFAAIAQAKENAEKNLQNARELFDSYLQSVFENNSENLIEEKMVDACSILTCGVASTPKYVDESVGVPFLSAQNVRNGEVVLDKYKFISQEFHEQLTKKNKPSKGDILYSRVGAKFGEAAVVEHDFDFSVYVSLTLIRPKAEKLNSYYLKHYLNSSKIKSLAKKTIGSSGVPNLNVNDVRKFPVKYPSLTRQKEIVSNIEHLSAETKKLENIYRQKINDLDELKKSILQKAFNGELTAKEQVSSVIGM